MNRVSATEMKNHFGRYLEMTISEPVLIQKTGRDVAVVLSIEEYEHLIALEDAQLAKKAIKAAKQGYLGKKESLKYIQSRL